VIAPPAAFLPALPATPARLRAQPSRSSIKELMLVLDMTLVRDPVGRRRPRRAGCVVLAGLITAGVLAADADAAARKRGQPRPRVHHGFHYGPSNQPPYADIVVDANSGRVLHEVNPDSPRHPASLTKIMTLYLLFEQMEAGRFRLDSELPISAHAAAQPPTKLRLKPGQTLTVEEAIKGLITRSANDVAVVVAEAVGGTEEDFAGMMTGKAHALGMAATVYVNASGLPADAQITTARDQAILGRAIQSRFPDYYRYFAIPSFEFRGRTIGNHNMLLKTVNGVDGIKTGFTQASGYNLVTSLRRDGRHVVGVVLGGTSNGARNARMRALVETGIVAASSERAAPDIVEATGAAGDISEGADAPALPQDRPAAAASGFSGAGVP
jgi:D-alanyl-D-alanine carboxypeptidase